MGHVHDHLWIPQVLSIYYFISIFIVGHPIEAPKGYLKTLEAYLISMSLGLAEEDTGTHI